MFLDAQAAVEYSAVVLWGWKIAEMSYTMTTVIKTIIVNRGSGVRTGDGLWHAVYFRSLMSCPALAPGL